MSVYLDHAATSPMRTEAVAAFVRLLLSSETLPRYIAQGRKRAPRLKVLGRN